MTRFVLPVLPVLALSAFTGAAAAVPLATFSIDGTDPAARIAAGNAVGPSSTATGVSVTRGITGVSTSVADGNLVAATNPNAQNTSFAGPLPGTAGNSGLADGLIAFGIPEQNKPAGSNTVASVLASGQGLSFTVTADAGSELDLDGGTLTLDYFLGFNQASTVSLFSSVDGFASPAAAVETISGITRGDVSSSGYRNVQALTFDFNGSQFDDLDGPVDFRLVFSGAQFDLQGNNNRRFTTVDNLVLNGEVAVVPEPASAALLAAGLGVMLLRRRGGN